jgi:hypothetical protein
VNDPEEGEDGPARAEVLHIVRVVHHYLPESSLSVRESVDVRRDLTFLVIEAHRHVFRRPVAVAVCSAVLTYVADALPEHVRATMLRSCAAHLGWALTADATPTGPPESLLSFLGVAADASSPRGDASGRRRAHAADGPPARGSDGRAAATSRHQAPPPAPSSPPRPRNGRDEGRT